MSGQNPRGRRSGSIRGAAPEPLGLGASPEGEMPAAGGGPEDAAAGEPFDETAPIGTSGRAIVPMVDPHAGDVIRDVPEMSVEDVERRIGTRARRQRRVEAAAPVTQRVAANRRVVLWRDSATILIFVVVALLAARLLIPSNAGTASATEVATESPVVLGSLPAGTGIQFSAAPTIGGVVPSGLHVDATPTPIPVITLPPPTPTPAATPTQKPGTTPKPTTKPTAAPSHTPAPTAAPTPAPTPAAPIAGFTNPCPSSSPTTAGTPLTFTDTSSGSITTYSWTFGDGGTDSSANGQHTYSAAGTFTVKLTVTGPGGTDSASDLCYVN